jgi:hypothetical protein
MKRKRAARFKEEEFWRDIETFGSLTFYIAVVARSLIGMGWTFFWELAAALAVSQVLVRVAGKILKQKISSHTANAGILLVLVNGYYKSVGFLLFSIVLFGLVCVSHHKLRKHSWSEISVGLVIGVLTGLAAGAAVPQII